MNVGWFNARPSNFKLPESFGTVRASCGTNKVASRTSPSGVERALTEPTDGTTGLNLAAGNTEREKKIDRSAKSVIISSGVQDLTCSLALDQGTQALELINALAGANSSSRSFNVFPAPALSPACRCGDMPSTGVTTRFIGMEFRVGEVSEDAERQDPGQQIPAIGMSDFSSGSPMFFSYKKVPLQFWTWIRSKPAAGIPERENKRKTQLEGASEVRTYHAEQAPEWLPECSVANGVQVPGASDKRLPPQPSPGSAG
ncbi:hypothetical protein B0H16DRAFT_1471716 [Mycena metata]|uniref:Uncharacterized protein n=1 Tax=Mycena metata TaxID=1033252 RepID=A0AAD7HQ41_9AGAR|nr:hypothetical protein B0H16DRAFT_1471716 [Mycena metata]